MYMCVKSLDCWFTFTASLSVEEKNEGWKMKNEKGEIEKKISFTISFYGMAYSIVEYTIRHATF